MEMEKEIGNLTTEKKEGNFKNQSESNLACELK